MGWQKIQEPLTQISSENNLRLVGQEIPEPLKIALTEDTKLKTGVTKDSGIIDTDEFSASFLANSTDLLDMSISYLELAILIKMSTINPSWKSGQAFATPSLGC